VQDCLSCLGTDVRDATRLHWLRLGFMGREQKSMTTDNTGPALPRHDEQLRDTVPGQPRGWTGPGRHRGPGDTTIVAEGRPRWAAIFLTLVGGVVVALIPWEKFPNQVKHLPVPGIATYLALVTTATVVGCFRSWRMGLVMDQHGATIRNYFRTYRFGWPEVNCLADGSAYAGADGWKWALSLMLHDGRAVTATGTMASGTRRIPKMLTVIRQGAEPYAIPTELTGEAVPRGSRWLIRVALMALVLIAAWLRAKS
jgi:hypothetical protein